MSLTRLSAQFLAEEVAKVTPADLSPETFVLMKAAVEAQCLRLADVKAELDRAYETCRTAMDAVGKLTLERDAARLAFAEASHNAGPAFVAHQELATTRDALERFMEGHAGLIIENAHLRAELARIKKFAHLRKTLRAWLASL